MSIIYILVSFLLQFISPTKPETPVRPQIQSHNAEKNYDLLVERYTDYFMKSDYLTAIIQRESKGDPTVISSTQDYGLFQINLIHWNKWGVDLNKWVKNGKFTMPVELQYYYCRLFVKGQVEYIVFSMKLQPTLQRIFDSWAGIAFIK